ncbi:hypothetical protein HRW18_32420 [Streptomyces lunaelactis]|uniref:hypothetical protein n=1 Tax=Streptomyces lunaelactis TaxID=1535768 RepID=UPI0015858B32|nr:hypothetical protein [Streptomyces lunaelactis]NUK12597.1 hypothetical protein [Streptomyces lunaelactis]
MKKRPPPRNPPPEAAPAPTRAHVYAVHNYRPAAGKPDVAGMPLVVLMLVTTTPAVLAAALLRPRSRSAASGRSSS